MLKTKSIMKRYLYILLVALVALVACEPAVAPSEPIVEFYFGEVSVETTHNSATVIADEPYMTVDGKKTEAKIWLRVIIGDIATPFEEYVAEGDKIIFEFDELVGDQTYYANLIVDGGEYGKKMSEKFAITTQKYIPKMEMTYTAQVDAKGLMATISLSNVAYLEDGLSADIHVIRAEYSRADAEQWASYEFKGSDIVNGALSVELPFEGGDYLAENSDYLFRFTLYPDNGYCEPLTSENIKFKTEYAEVTANIATPTLSLQSNSIKASVENIEVFYDGIPAEEYKDGYPVKYYFYYRVKGNNDWSKTEVTATNGDISASIEAQEGNTYEVKALIVAGGMQKVRESAIAEIVVPKKEVPTPPAVGAGDTSEIAGTWHLTEWRGAVPSFDIYLDITTDGVVTLWQRMESREWECFYSTAAFEDGLLCGTYTDGAAWGASYSVTISGDTMTWVDANDSTDISVYTRSELPNIESAAGTRSVQIVDRFL
jgi:hypothetical protein